MTYKTYRTVSRYARLDGHTTPRAIAAALRRAPDRVTVVEVLHDGDPPAPLNPKPKSAKRTIAERVDALYAKQEKQLARQQAALAHQKPDGWYERKLKRWLEIEQRDAARDIRRHKRALRKDPHAQFQVHMSHASTRTGPEVK